MLKKDIRTEFTNHLEDDNEVLKVSDVVDGQVDFGMPKVPDTIFKTFVTCGTCHGLVTNTHSQIQGAILDWNSCPFIELICLDFGL